MTRHSLLFISPRFLFPNDSGGKIRTTQILRGMKGGAFKITLMSPARENQVEEFREELSVVSDHAIVWPASRARGWASQLKRAFSIFSKRPISVESDYSSIGASMILNELNKNHDLVVFDFPHSVALAPQRLELPSVIFTHNVESEILQRHAEVAGSFFKKILWGNQYKKMFTFESAILNSFTRVVAVSDRDKYYFSNNFNVKNVGVIPTGVDLDFFSYKKPADSKQLVFVGSMDWLANIDALEYFMEEMWPLIVREEPDVELKIIGRNPPSKLIQKAAPLNWNFTGFVDDIRVEVESAAVCIIPLRVGGGTRIKAFEAMAMGLPMVSTPVGMEGLDVLEHEHYLPAQNAVEFANGVLKLLRESDLREKISLVARAHVERYFSYRIAAEKFEEICLGALR